MCTGGQAHEFWIEPVEGTPAVQQPLEVQVFVGEDFDGEVFPFEPRAYREAYWIGPSAVNVLHTRSLANGMPSLMFQAEGLHILAVASYPTALVHETVDDFVAFAEEVGASNMIAENPPNPNQNGGLRETYRRFSKVLTHLGGHKGQDRQLGFQYEWVKSWSGITLYAGDKVASHHPVDLHCRYRNGQVAQERLLTDDMGRVAYRSTLPERCLINAVFLTPPAPGRDWSSDWVSMTWDP